MVKQLKKDKKQHTMTLIYSERNFGDCGLTNDVGDPAIGKMADEGYSVSDLKHAGKKFIDAGSRRHWTCEAQCLLAWKFLESLKAEVEEDARVLIVRNGVNILLKEAGKTADDMEVE